jgi:hypothetical protein
VSPPSMSCGLFEQRQGRFHLPCEPTRSEHSLSFSSYRLPPPCETQYSVLPRALLPHVSAVHVRPPPCATQNAVLPRDARRQPSNEQRRPPPCAMHSPEPPYSDANVANRDISYGLARRLEL